MTEIIDIKRELEYLIDIYTGMAGLDDESVAHFKEIGCLSGVSHARGSASVCRMVCKDLRQLLDRLEDRHG